MSYSASIYLIVRRRGNRYKALTVRVAERAPTLQPGEVPIYLTVTLPDALFEKPTLRAQVKVEDGKVPPTLITAEVAENIAEQLQKLLGVEVKISVEAPE
jgi:hypothetical protein